MFPVIRESALTVAVMSKYVNMWSKYCTRSCICRGIRKACFFSKLLLFLDVGLIQL